MKAAVFTEYGPPEVLQLKEVAKPSPKDNEILIKIYATPINFADTLIRNFKAISPKKFHMPFLFWLIGKITFGFRKPKITILGSEFAGEVEAVGKTVTRFKIGDQVFGYCGPRMGTNAEYLCMRGNGVVAIKPANMSYEEAAAVPYGAIMALNVLRKANLQPGHKILVNGASGGIGPAVVQLARSHFGATVTGVCGTSRLEYVKSLGADQVIDYTKEDFTASQKTYDFIIDILGKSPFARCKRSLTPDGRCLYVSFKMKQVFQMLQTSMTGSRKVVCVLVNEKSEDLIFIKELIEAGKIKSVIDRCFPLEQTAEAHRYAESGSKKGNVVITVK
ncbi:MAG: NAD(P)-dependent alcohol dehydrogenase [Candidatus Aminicenantes bacterium]|nr:NAD(P)-dependent alcohol dehydrogenase [Candidatus Aminicenantes bacterium]